VVRAARPAEFVINLRRDGTVTLEGRLASLPALRGRLRARLDRAAAKNERLRVIVRADRRGRFGQLDEVLGLCRRAGVEQIIMRTVRRGAR
jgi:biopolymer transport protein ExbD